MQIILFQVLFHYRFLQGLKFPVLYCKSLLFVFSCWLAEISLFEEKKKKRKYHPIYQFSI